MLTLCIILQAGGRSRGGLTMPYDSTQGVGAGLYWFSGAFLLFIVLGVLKALWDDRKWTGRNYSLPDRKSKIRRDH